MSSKKNKRIKPNKVSQFNWSYVVLGLLVLYWGVFSNTSKEIPHALIQLKVEMSSDMLEVKEKNDYRYSYFQVKEYPVEFIILIGSISPDINSKISDLRAGQKLDLKIKDSDFTELNNAETEVVVHELSAYGKTLFTAKEFQNNRALYDKRYWVLALFLGSMLLLNGFFSISSNTNLIIGGSAFLAVILMRVFQFGLY